MDLGRALGYPMKDPNWIVKLLIGAVISLVPLVNFITYGYLIRVVRQVMDGEEETMPEWDDFGGDFVKGLLSFFGTLLYYAPILAFYCCIIAAISVTSSSDGEGSGFAGLLILCTVGLVFLYILVTAPLIAAAYARYAATDDFSDAFFNFGARISEVRSHLSESIMLIVLYLVVQIITGIVVGLTIWICGLGLLFAWGGYVISGHLLAQYGLAIGVKNDSQTSDIAFA